MSERILVFENKDGREVEVVFDPEDSVLNLDKKGIVSIDLEPLRGSDNLVELQLGSNKKENADVREVSVTLGQKKRLFNRSK